MLGIRDGPVIKRIDLDRIGSDPNQSASIQIESSTNISLALPVLQYILQYHWLDATFSIFKPETNMFVYTINEILKSENEC